MNQGEACISPAACVVHRGTQAQLVVDPAHFFRATVPPFRGGRFRSGKSRHRTSTPLRPFRSTSPNLPASRQAAFSSGQRTHLAAGLRHRQPSSPASEQVLFVHPKLRCLHRFGSVFQPAKPPWKIPMLFGGKFRNRLREYPNPRQRMIRFDLLRRIVAYSTAAGNKDHAAGAKCAQLARIVPGS